MAVRILPSHRTATSVGLLGPAGVVKTGVLVVRPLNQLSRVVLQTGRKTRSARSSRQTVIGSRSSREASSRRFQCQAARVVVLCDAPSGRGGSWGDNGWIVFTPNASGNTIPAARKRERRCRPSSSRPCVWVTRRNVGRKCSRAEEVSSFPRRPIWAATTTERSSCNRCRTATGESVVKGGFFGRYVPKRASDVRAQWAVVRRAIRPRSGWRPWARPCPFSSGSRRTVSNGAAQFDVSDTGIAAYIGGRGGPGAAAAVADPRRRHRRRLRAAPVELE